VYALVGTLNGNETVCEVFAPNVNGGLVNMRELALLRPFGCSGPLNMNLMTTVCDVLEHEITLPGTVIHLLRASHLKKELLWLIVPVGASLQRKCAPARPV
jgi:hypothetical protein